jgi:polyhydroxyalkanoate synthesis regulator phasin
MKTIQNCWNSAKILPKPVAVAVGPQPDVMKELSDMLLLLAQAGETDTMAAEDMCEIDEELLSALPLGVDDEEVELVALADSMQEASSAVEDDSVYRVPISLKEARRYMDELKYFIQENRPAMERHVEPAAALIKDLTAMHISAHSVQSSIHAFFQPAPRPASDSHGDGCAAGGKAK